MIGQRIILYHKCFSRSCCRKLELRYTHLCLQAYSSAISNVDKHELASSGMMSNPRFTIIVCLVQELLMGLTPIEIWWQTFHFPYKIEKIHYKYYYSLFWVISPFLLWLLSTLVFHICYFFWRFCSQVGADIR